MRIIDAEDPKLLRELKFIRGAEYQIYGRGSWGFTAKCEHAIEDAPTVQSELRWISVEQELPKIGEYVLCRTKACVGKHHVCKFVDKDKWVDRPHFDWNHNGFPHVIAWTRFEPYKGVTE